MTKTVAIIAGGPSLAREDVSKVESVYLPIIGINNAYQICDRLSILYSCDANWWRHHYDNVRHLACLKISLESTSYHDVLQVENDGLAGMSYEWPRVRTGGNSAYQAINVAFLLGFQKIILLGYDLQAIDGKLHWHGGHPKTMNNPNVHRFEEWTLHYDGLAKLLELEKVQVFNASRSTALNCFPKVKIDDVLSQC